MSHSWCRDISRDEQVRAAEDAAAVPAIQHRDLPEAVAALTERVAELTRKHNSLAELARLDAGWLKANEQRLTAERDEARARVAELEAAPPPRGWLTAEEREALEEAMVDYGSNVGDSDCERMERVLRALLAREMPPKVTVPPVILGALPRVREQQWIAAIRAAGGEVE